MIQTTSERVAESVRVEAARRNLPQSKLAEVLGTSQQSISRRLSGKKPFDVEEIYRLANTFGMAVAALLPDATTVPTALAVPEAGGDSGPSPKRLVSPPPV